MKAVPETLILTAADVIASLDPRECHDAVERAFEALGRGRAAPPRLLGFDVPGGTFHVKAAALGVDEPRFVAKLNGNFPGNGVSGLPTIQGVLVMSDARDGRPLAIMDSASITGLRTAAATTVALSHLARRGAATAAIIGCGAQGRFHLAALEAMGGFEEIRLFDLDRSRAVRLAERNGPRAVLCRVVDDVPRAARGAAVVVTCTTGADFVLGEGDVEPGAFVAAVGADNPRKREIHPALMRRARVVVDDLAQCAEGGDLHHAIRAGAMTADDVHGDLASIIAGTRPGRSGEDEVFLFDSTGIALEDVAAAMVVFERARAAHLGTAVRLGA